MFYPLLSHEFRHFFRQWRPWRFVLAQHDIDSSVRFGKEKFLAALDVHHFKPENITIKVTDDNIVTVEGKHEEKQEGKGYVSRHFVKRFILPRGHDMNKVESKLSSDGILTICAPRVVEKNVEDKARAIPIMQTGKPFEKESKGDTKKK